MKHTNFPLSQLINVSKWLRIRHKTNKVQITGPQPQKKKPRETCAIVVQPHEQRLRDLQHRATIQGEGPPYGGGPAKGFKQPCP